MSEKTEITFMQTRLIRLASEEWHLPVEQITSKEQAESFLRTSIAKAIAIGTIEEGQQAIRRQTISASASCCPIN